MTKLIHLLLCVSATLKHKCLCGTFYHCKALPRSMFLISHHLREDTAFNSQLWQEKSASHPHILAKWQSVASYAFHNTQLECKWKEFRTSSSKFLFLNYKSKENSTESKFRSLSAKHQVFLYCCIKLQLPAVPQQNRTCAACWNVNHYTAIWWTLNNSIALEQMNIDSELEKLSFLPESWQISKNLKNIWNTTDQITAFHIIPDWLAKKEGKRYFLKDTNGLVSRCKPICSHKGDACTGGKIERSSALPAARWCYWAIMNITTRKAQMDQIPLMQS